MGNQQFISHADAKQNIKKLYKNIMELCLTEKQSTKKPVIVDYMRPKKKQRETAQSTAYQYNIKHPLSHVYTNEFIAGSALSIGQVYPNKPDINKIISIMNNTTWVMHDNPEVYKQYIEIRNEFLLNQTLYECGTSPMSLARFLNLALCNQYSYLKDARIQSQIKQRMFE